MVFVKRITHTCSRPGHFGYVVFEENKFKEWVDSFMAYEAARREFCLSRDMSVGAGFLTDYKWTTVTGADASALATYVCDGYNNCVGKIPTIEHLKKETERFKNFLEEENRNENS